MNIFETKSDSIKHSHTSHNVMNTYAHLSDLDKIRNILTSRISNEDLENVKKEDMSAETFDEKNLKEISPDNPKAHRDSNLDAIYTSLPKRISKSF